MGSRPSTTSSRLRAGTGAGIDDCVDVTDAAEVAHDTADVTDIAGGLRAAGLAPTSRRRLVLEALGDRTRPVSAHELYVELAGSGHRVGMSTVYRTLSALADAGLLHVFAGEGETREARYRRCDSERHYHLVCRRCGDVAEQPADDELWLERIAAAADFCPDPRQTELYGVCGTCLRTARRPDRHNRDVGETDPPVDPG
jgi:Fur family ferric uptake transcriptional regulator